MTPSEAFFTVHRDLPREGPGVPEDLHWALDIAGTPENARICDAGCGPGADTVTLAEARPRSTIDAVDITPHFVAEAARRSTRFGSRVRVSKGDYTEIKGPYDLIWCAGAVYFHGFLNVLEIWRTRLRTGGAVAFSEPAWVTVPPTPEARAFWGDQVVVHDEHELTEALKASGWRIAGHRWLIGAPWANYYDPMRARLAKLRTGPTDAALSDAIAEADREITNWQAAPDQIAYLLFVVRPA